MHVCVCVCIQTNAERLRNIELHGRWKQRGREDMEWGVETEKEETLIDYYCMSQE